MAATDEPELPDPQSREELYDESVYPHHTLQTLAARHDYPESAGRASSSDLRAYLEAVLFDGPPAESSRADAPPATSDESPMTAAPAAGAPEPEQTGADVTAGAPPDGSAEAVESDRSDAAATDGGDPA